MGQRFGRRMLEVVVPNVDERHQDGNVVAEWRFEEVGIHRVCAGQHFAECFFSPTATISGRPMGDQTE